MKVFCTNPTLTYSFGHLIDIRHHENEIPDGIVQNGSLQQVYCQHCQMPLILNKRYIPIQPLGSGGFGLTFLARDHKRHQTCVVKRLIARDGLEPEVRERIRSLFMQEAEILENLRHDQIPKLWDHFEEPLPTHNPDEAMAYYLVQEYIEGQDLQKELQQLQQQGKKGFSEAEVIQLLQQILDVLKYIHKPRSHRPRATDGQRRTLIHRDIKPSNIMRGIDGEFYLIDFGSVKQVVQSGIPADQSIAAGQGLPNQPSTLTSVGTEAYCPYLQLHPQPGDRPEPWWDLYALATTCVKLLTGENPKMLGVPHNNHWQKAAQVDPRLAKILNRMMGVGVNANQQYQDAAEVLQDLESLTGNPSRFSPKLAALIGGSMLVGGLLLWTGIRLNQCNYSVGCFFGGTNYQSNHTPPENPPQDILPAEALISAGEKQIVGSQLLSSEYEFLKRQGFNQFEQQNYRAAQNSFSQIRIIAREKYDSLSPTENPDYQAASAALRDPQVMIYGNNATVRLRHQQGQPIYTIAAALPVSDKTGREFPVGQQMLFGVALAQKKAVEAGINLEVLIANDRNIPTQAQTVAQGLTNWSSNDLEARRVLAVVGHYTSPVTCAALPFYSEASIVVISPTSTLTELRESCQDQQQVFFRTSSSSAVEADTFVRYMVEKRKIANPQVAIFYNPNEGFSRDLTEQFERLLEGKGTIVQKIDLSNPNFSLDQTLADTSSANVLAVFSDGRTGNRITFDRAVQVLKAVSDDRLILGSNTLYQNEVLGAAKNNSSLAGRFLIAVDWHPQCSAEAFSKTYSNTWLGDVNRLTALSYEAVQVLSAAFQEGISSPAALRNKLRTIDIRSDVFDRKRLSFTFDGNRRDITTRLLATPTSDMKRFVLLDGEICS